MTTTREGSNVAVRQRGIEVGDLLRWPGVPPMLEFSDPDGNRFEFSDPDGNRFEIVANR
ncbi:MAG TPA: hypothetical protein VN840_14120 [Streptosporangiaceae bacterium]|nr:hypothetical protein [Streptosporangiaceae bacterium]